MTLVFLFRPKMNVHFRFVFCRKWNFIFVGIFVYGRKWKMLFVRPLVCILVLRCKVLVLVLSTSLRFKHLVESNNFVGRNIYGCSAEGKATLPMLTEFAHFYDIPQQHGTYILSKDVHNLERIQRRAARFVTNDYTAQPQSPVFSASFIGHFCPHIEETGTWQNAKRGGSSGRIAIGQF